MFGNDLQLLGLEVYMSTLMDLDASWAQVVVSHSFQIQTLAVFWSLQRSRGRKCQEEGIYLIYFLLNHHHELTLPFLGLELSFE